MYMKEEHQRAASLCLRNRKRDSEESKAVGNESERNRENGEGGICIQLQELAVNRTGGREMERSSLLLVLTPPFTAACNEEQRIEIDGLNLNSLHAICGLSE
jgi:hypothetical protein